MDFLQHRLFVRHEQVVTRIAETHHARTGDTALERGRLTIGHGLIDPLEFW
jgi:hypothetical protein